MWMDVWNCGCRERYPHEWGQEGRGRTGNGRPTSPKGTEVAGDGMA